MFVARREQSTEQRQHRITRRKRTEYLAVTFDIGPSEKTTIGFLAADTMASFRDRVLHTGDYIRTANLSLRLGDMG